MTDTQELHTDLVLDLGNAGLKGCVVRPNGGREELTIPHALAVLPESEFDEIRAQYGGLEYGNSSYFMLDGVPYVAGEYAEQYASIQRRSGNLKYTRDYYGALMVSMLLRFFPDGNDNLRVFVCHPPSDRPYRKEQMKSVKGRFIVKTSGQRAVTYNIRYVNTFIEPLGGYMNVVLDDNGNLVPNNPVATGRKLVVDVGGRISNTVPVNEAGEVEYGLARSTHYGILDVLAEFEKMLRIKYYEDFAKTRVIPQNRLRDALRSGVYRGGGHALSCTEEADRALNLLVNRLWGPYYEDAGGPNQYDHILVTGGGGGASYQRLEKDLFNHNSVFLAEKPSEMHFANVRGGAKLWTMLINNGLLS